MAYICGAKYAPRLLPDHHNTFTLRITITIALTINESNEHIDQLNTLEDHKQASIHPTYLLFTLFYSGIGSGAE